MKTLPVPAPALHGEAGPVEAPPAVGALEAHPVSLRSNFAWTLAGNLVYAGCQWAMLIVIARLTEQAAVGKFAFGFAVTAPVFLLAGMQVRSVQATDAARRFPFSDYLGVALLGMLVALAVSAAIALGSSHDRETRLVVLAVAACKAVEGVSDVYYGGLHQVERMRPIAVALVWRGVMGILALGAVLWAGGSLLMAIAALGAVWLAVLLAHTLPAVASLLRARGERVAPRLLWRTAGQIAAVALPLGVVNMLVSLRANVPRYFVEGYGGAAELGVFAALSSLVVAGSLVVGALGQSATPRLARYHFEGQLRAFRRLLALLLAFAGVIGIAGVALAAVAGRPVLRLLFGPSYEARADVLVWLMAAGVVSYASSFLGFALTAARRFRVQVPLFAATGLACAATCWWLVPGRGLMGAAWGWGLSFLLELVVMAAILWVALRRSPIRE